MKSITLSITTYNALPASMRRVIEGVRQVLVAGQWRRAILVK